MTVIEIEIISDIVCVWCYIGKRTLSKAISLYQKTYPNGKTDTFSIKWSPYYLSPNQSSPSVDKRELAKIKLSGMSEEKKAAITQRVNQVGQSLGIEFKYGGKIGSTRDAHRLIHFSEGKSAEVRDRLVEKLFEAYHELERDISDCGVLREIAVDAGIGVEEVDEWLSSDIGGEVVDEGARRNRERVDNAGVPYFIIQGVHVVDGAQDFQEFFEAFVKVKEAEIEAR